MSPRRERYRWDLLPRIASDIEHAEREQAHRDLNLLLQIVARQSGPDLVLRKMRCAQILSASVRAARRGGGPSDRMMGEQFGLLRRLKRARSWRAAEALVHRHVDHLVDYVRPARPSRVERMVSSIRKDVRATLGRPRSLGQYATDLRISPGHLSRSFAAIAGRAFREFVRDTRIEKACELLSETDLKVGAVAREVGIKSASQFIADFREAMGVTPKQYRGRR